MVKMCKYTFGMWKGAEDKNIVVSVSILSKVRAGVLFLERV